MSGDVGGGGGVSKAFWIFVKFDGLVKNMFLSICQYLLNNISTIGVFTGAKKGGDRVKIRHYPPESIIWWNFVSLLLKSHIFMFSINNSTVFQLWAYSED